MTGTAFEDGDIVWVKLSNCWWPGEVHGDDRLPSDIVGSFKKKKPLAIIKFFQEDSYEYVMTPNNIYAYHCPRRLDFIRKGLDMFQANHKFMEMFPADVATAERKTHGDPDIINDPAVLNPSKPISLSKKWSETTAGDKKGSPGNATRKTNNQNAKTANNKPGPNKTLVSSPSASNAASAAAGRPNKEHEVRILSSATTNRSPALSNSVLGGGVSASGMSPSSSQMYKCHLCNFSSGRMNLLILHSKSHSTATSLGSDGNVDSRRSSLTNRSTSTSMLTPTKRFSTTSSCSTSSPALSPVSSPPRRTSVAAPPAPTAASPAAAVRAPAVVQNKSRPPKKRTKRMSSSTEEPQPPTTDRTAVVPAVASSRRSRNRRRSSTPVTVEDEPAEAKTTTTTSKPAAASVKSSPAPVKAKKTNLEKSLLMDWSDDDDAEAEVKSTSPAKETSTDSPAKTSPVTAVVSPSGRSSPIRCRNIPKKDRREIVFEEFEPKILPNRTQETSAGGESAAVDVEVKMEEEEAVAEPEPIVQKKKKAAIERLSQKVPTQSVANETEKALEKSPPKPTEEQNNNNNKKSPNSDVVSCFDFDDEKPTVGEVNPVVVVEEEEQNKIKEEINKKDEELLAEIGDILNSTSDIVRATTDQEEISPSKSKLSELSLPPKERGKRIFKSRNNLNEKEAPESDVTTSEESPVKAESVPVKCEAPAEDSQSALVPRKRRFEEEKIPTPPKVRKMSPEPTEQKESEFVKEEEEEPEIKDQIEIMEVADEQKLEQVVTKPKINNSHSEEINNGDRETGSPKKTNDLLSPKVVQKVQIVQRVRGQGASDVTETKVAKINSADSGNVLSVAITQSGAITATTATEETLSPVTTTAPETEVNGTLQQESPPSAIPETTASPDAGGGPTADQQILAIPGETFDGPPNSFYLCTVDDGNFIPIDNQPLYLDASNQLVPTPPTLQTVMVMGDAGVAEISTEELVGEEEEEVLPQIVIGPEEQVVDLTDTDAKYILTTGTGQQILLDLQSLLTIASGGEAPRLVCDGQEMVIDGTPQEILSSITQCTAEFEDTAGHDIIGGALGDGSVVYPTVTTAYVSETNAVLTQPPIMSTLEVPSKADVGATAGNLEESLAVIGVKKEAKSIPASLELPITITNPKIAAKTTQASIKSVYMTTTVCGSRMEPEAAAGELWIKDTREENANGHDEQTDQIVEEESATEEETGNGEAVPAEAGLV